MTANRPVATSIPSPSESPEPHPRNVSAAQRRVGTTPVARLAWAVAFAQRDLEGMTPGDWSNLQVELTAFAAFLIREQDLGNIFKRDQLQHADDYRYGNAIYSREEVRELHGQFQKAIRQLIENGWVRLGPYHFTMHVYRWPPGRRRRKGGGPLESVLPEGRDRATYVLGHLMHIYGAHLKGCPAPAPRGRRGERCDRWFLARRPNQTYCSVRCQSRVTTRAARRKS